MQRTYPYKGLEVTVDFGPVGSHRQRGAVAAIVFVVVLSMGEGDVKLAHASYSRDKGQRTCSERKRRRSWRGLARRNYD
jgi:hypothetical protein